MKSGQKNLLSHTHSSQDEIPGDSLPGGLDRRRFLQFMAAAGAVAGFGGRAFAQGGAADAANRRLPDGTELPIWEQQPTFSKTYYVDNQSARADDSGPGTQQRPFRTISQAAKVLQPGERVVIAAGTYREFVRPERGGTSPTQMISYEAAPGAKVYIKGSDVIKQGWTEDPVQTFRRPGGGPNGAAGAAPATPPPPPVHTWGFQFTGAMFPDAYNPFALASVAGDRAWLDTKAVDMGPYFRRRGLVFMDGKPLEPVELQRELTSPTLFRPPAPGAPPSMSGLPPRARGGPLMQEIGGTENARFWTDANGQSIHIRLPNGTPADHTIEVTMREQVFAPANRGLNYIRVKGLTFAHAGNGFPLPQRGAMVDTQGGNRWIFEDNTFEWANAIGLEIGGGFGGFGGGAGAAPQQAQSAHVVRGNTFRYCGVEGVAGMGTRDVLIENNLIEWCGWADAEREWESAGAKFHRAENMLFRNNVVRHMRHANGIWLDSGDRNCRISGNVFADTLSVSAAIHMEMNRQPNQIDNNIIWDVRNAEPGTPGQRGCAGSGIFINASDQITIAQNLIGRVDNSGVYAIVRPDRAGSGLASENVISNNIFTKCGKTAIVFLNQKNEADGNVFAGMPADFLGFFTGDNKQYVDLAAWRQTHGWDKNSIEANLQIDFNPDTLELTINGAKQLPRVGAVKQITDDIFGKMAGTTRVPGPIADPGAKTVWKVDPRTATSA